LIRARWPVLGLTGFICAGIAIYLAMYTGAVAATATEAIAISGTTFLATLWLLRSLRLAALAALTPVATAVLSLGILTPIAIAEPALCSVLVPHAVATMLLPTAGTAIYILYGYLLETCAGAESGPAAWASVGRAFRPAVMALVAASLWRLLLLTPVAPVVPGSDNSFLAAGVTALCAAVVCLVLLPLMAGVIRLSEDTIAKANRQRERRERIVGLLDFVTTPRWALSLVGIAVVFGAIAVFGGRGPSSAMALWREHGILFPVTVSIAGLIGAVGTRDWRAFLTCSVPPALAATLSGLTVAKFGIVLILQIGGAVDLPGVSVSGLLPITTALGAGFCYLVAARIAMYRMLDDPLDVAFVRTLTDVALPVVAATLAVAAALLPLGLAVAPVLCAAAALILTPALTAAIELVFPKLKSVEELYGRAKSEPR
jgi:hypothetical protein